MNEGKFAASKSGEASRRALARRPTEDGSPYRFACHLCWNESTKPIDADFRIERRVADQMIQPLARKHRRPQGTLRAESVDQPESLQRRMPAGHGTFVR